MGKLHELLAVEPDLRAKAQQESSRIQKLFIDGRGKLVGEIRTYHPLQEHGEQLETKQTRLGTSVSNELLTLNSALSSHIDASVQKEITNTSTCADVVVDGKPIIKDLPATALLNLEGKLAVLRKVYASIPTLDPSEDWKWDDGLGCYVSQDRTQYRTKKIPRTLVKAEATEQHPAQVDVWMEDVQVGSWNVKVFSGMVTAKQKYTWLSRIDTLLGAVKQARQRANCAEASSRKVSDVLFKYISGAD